MAESNVQRVVPGFFAPWQIARWRQTRILSTARSRAGWITSDRGPGGGYSLTVNLTQISLLDVLEGVEGPAETGRCVLRDGPCPGTQTCPIHEAWMAARTELVERLSSLTMADVLPAEVTK